MEAERVKGGRRGGRRGSRKREDFKGQEKGGKGMGVRKEGGKRRVVERGREGDRES